MLDPQSMVTLRAEIERRLASDAEVLTQLREEVRPLRDQVRPIQARSTTAISLVGTDGGNNKIDFDPFMLQLIRVVDSSNNEYCLEAVSPTSDVRDLSAAQFDAQGNGVTALGRMMKFLGVRTLPELSHMIRLRDGDEPMSPSWVQVYRELVEWAVLFSVLREKQFGTDTILVADGLLRSKAFAGDLFKKLMDGIASSIQTQFQSTRRRLYLVGVAKKSKVLARYRLALGLEGILRDDFPAFVEVPRDLEEKSYIWSEYARGDDTAIGGGELNKFVGGKMFFVKFGSRSGDPVWPTDVFLPQIGEAGTILGYLLADALSGFPVPFYPQCLQKAHENAALVDFDFDVLQDTISDGVRRILGAEAPVLDALSLQAQDPAAARY